VISSGVLDSSAMLAWLQREPGWERVDQLIDSSVISAANWSEVLQKVAQRGRDTGQVVNLFHELGVSILPLTEEDAEAAAMLWRAAPHLSLGDRCCLALCQRLGLPAVTADSAWSAPSLPVSVVLIR
jgi:PIN domain nuclease of toxin-antitoxin system